MVVVGRLIFIHVVTGYRHIRLRNDYEQIIDGATLLVYSNTRHMSLLNGRQELRVRMHVLSERATV